jgi:hypothetical protein
MHAAYPRLAFSSEAMEEQFIADMTVNDRLIHFGLLDLFDAAVRARDVRALVQVLVRAKFPEEQATRTAKAVAADPQRYGYQA